jgi:hypothetical protein
MLIERLLKYRKEYPRKNKIDDLDLINDLKNYEFLYNDEASLKEKAAAVIIGLNERPQCECGAFVKFNTKSKETPYGGWNQYCSRICMQKSTKTIEKRKQTTLERYGETSWAKTDLAKETSTRKWSLEKKKHFREELIKTYQDKHSVDFYSQTEEYLTKRNNTILNATNGKYNNYFQDVNNIKSSLVEKYGVDSWSKTEEGKTLFSLNNPMKNPSLVLKSKLTRASNKYNEELFEIIINNDSMRFKSYINTIAKNNNFVHRKEISNYLGLSYSFLNNLFRRFDMANDYITLGTSISYEEETVFQFVQSIYNGKIKRGDRTILNGREIDIVLPELKLGIEYNGIRYHSELGGKDKFYHFNKTEEAEEAGYQLLHIFSTEWMDAIKRPIWESIIRAKCGLLQNKIFARKCVLSEIDSKVANSFFTYNHLSGSVAASHYLGLFYNNELVSALSYGQSRFSKNETEIYRFASLLNTSVIGAFGKFMSSLPKEGLVSFADRRIASNNTCYDKFFAKKSKCYPNWYGFDLKTCDLKHRWNFITEKVKFLIKDYDDTKSVSDNMFANGYDKIWDSGNWKYYN